MGKKFIILMLVLSIVTKGMAQEEENAEEKKGFKKENLFTGGSISLMFSNNIFLIGGNPMFGYNVTRWADAGIVVNYTYSSQRDYYVFDDRMRQSTYGGGVFTRIYPVRFLFGQAQVEHNFIRLKYLPRNSSGSTEVNNTSASSVLVGGGYTTGRRPEAKNGFFYLSVLFDVTKNENSPYTDAAGRAIPIFRAGVQIPLFQGRREMDY